MACTKAFRIIELWGYYGLVGTIPMESCGWIPGFSPVRERQVQKMQLKVVNFFMAISYMNQVYMVI